VDDDDDASADAAVSDEPGSDAAESDRDASEDTDSKSDGGTHAEAGADASMDASARDAAVSDASTALMDNRLQPFEVGRSWTYRRVMLDGGVDTTCMGSLESSVSKTVMRDAAVGYEYVPTCLGTTRVQMFFDGDDIWAYVGAAPEPVHYAASPVEAGVSWDAGAFQYLWAAQDTAVVPAGTFDRCIRRIATNAQGSYLVLCRGVGLVLSESPSENYRLELVSKNF
jgi:hypothetical protein